MFHPRSYSATVPNHDIPDTPSNSLISLPMVNSSTKKIPIEKPVAARIPLAHRLKATANKAASAM